MSDDDFLSAELRIAAAAIEDVERLLKARGYYASAGKLRDAQNVIRKAVARLTSTKAAA